MISSDGQYPEATPEPARNTETLAIQALSAALDADDTANMSYVLVPSLEEEGAHFAVFGDGSYTRWIPSALVSVLALVGIAAAVSSRLGGIVYSAATTAAGAASATATATASATAVAAAPLAAPIATAVAVSSAVGVP